MKRLYALFLIFAWFSMFTIEAMPVWAAGFSDDKTNAILIPLASLIGEDRILQGADPRGKSLAFSPDGRILASGSGSVMLWDLATGDSIITFDEQPGWVYALAFSPDGRILASGQGEQIDLWDVATWKRLKTLRDKTYLTYQVRSIAFSPDGKKLASGSFADAEVIVWDVATGNKIKTLRAHRIGVLSVAFSPDGKILASRGREETVIFWDTATWNNLRTFEDISSAEGERCIAFSPDGKIFASGGSGRAVIWEVANGRKIRTLEGHPGAVKSIAFGPNGRLLASADGDTVILWDVATGNKIKTLTGHSDIYSISFSPDGKILASAGSKLVTLTDIGTFLALSGGTGENLINTIEMERDQEIKRLFTKGEFETTKEYEERVKTVKKEENRLREQYDARINEAKKRVEKERTNLQTKLHSYSFRINLGKYDADKGGFKTEILEHQVLIKVPREKAKELLSRKDNVYIEGKLRYFDPEQAELLDAKLVEPVSNERFAVLKTGKRPVVALAKKPEIKRETPAYTSKSIDQKAPLVDIYDIPDFKPSPRDKDMAVIIGIEKYRGLPKSDYSKSDAGVVKAYLKALGFHERNIEFLTDERATRTDIEKAIEGWLPNRVKKDSRVIIYYSGHGAPEPKTGEAYMVPYDGDPNYLEVTGYSLKRLYEKLGKLQAVEVVVLLDSCFSGAGGRSVLAKGARPLVMMISSAVIPQNIAVLSATQGTQISTSSPDKGHGIFTYYFLKALKDGKKDIAEIYSYIKPLVEDDAKQINVQQSPSISPDIEKLKGRFILRR